jgi:hypothetical protein
MPRTGFRNMIKYPKAMQPHVSYCVTETKINKGWAVHTHATEKSPLANFFKSLLLAYSMNKLQHKMTRTTTYKHTSRPVWNVWKTEQTKRSMELYLSIKIYRWLAHILSGLSTLRRCRIVGSNALWILCNVGINCGLHRQLTWLILGILYFIF